MPTSRRTLVLCLLAMSAWLIAACGGRFRTIDEVDDGTAAGRSSAGSASAGRGGFASGGRAGADSAGAPASGAPSAGAPSAGASSAGAGGCGNVNCPFISCGAAYAPVTLPGMCCPVCQQNCQQIGCPDIACPPGSTPEVPPGQCCPVCDESAGDACSKGMDAYQTQRAQFLDKYSHGCKTGADCTVVAPVNSCESGCQYEALFNGAASNFSSNLASVAAMDCQTCPMQPTPPCDPPPPPLCFHNQCVFSTLR